MNVKLDENLPRGLVFGLRLLGHDVHTPCDEGLSAARDSQIWEAAQLERRFLVSRTSISQMSTGSLRAPIAESC